MTLTLEGPLRFFSPGQLIHQLPGKTREVGNSCPFRQWLLYPPMFKPSGEKPVEAQQRAVTGRLSLIRCDNIDIESLVALPQP